MLKQPQLRFFSKGEIEPQGWLKRQLRIQGRRPERPPG